MLHRDLKPDKVLAQGTHPLLTDSGLVLDDDAGNSRLTANEVFTRGKAHRLVGRASEAAAALARALE